MSKETSPVEASGNKFELPLDIRALSAPRLRGVARNSSRHHRDIQRKGPRRSGSLALLAAAVAA